MVNSLIRYVGSKSKALDSVLSALPRNIEEYREPMIGSGIVTLGMLQSRVRPKKILIGDYDYDIANFWEQVINKPDELLSKAIEIKDNIISDIGNINIEEELSLFGKNNIESASIMWILNNCKELGNYGNLMSKNKIFDRLLNFENVNKHSLYSVSNLMHDIEVRNESYEWALREDGDNVCIFLDPPYYNVVSKDGYYKEHKNFDFGKFTKELLNTKHKFVMTIDISEYSEELKKYFNVEEYEIFYLINRKWTKEYIVTNFNKEECI